jgi:phosphatidylglycerophosphate synthase
MTDNKRLSVETLTKGLATRLVLVQAITLSRALAAIVFAAIAFVPAYHGLAALLFLYALLGDFLDGPIARYLGTTSRVGATLDGFADKYHSVVSALYLAASGYDLAACSILVLRDALVPSLRSVYVNGAPLIPVRRMMGGLSGGPIKCMAGAVLIAPEWAIQHHREIQNILWLLAIYSVLLLGFSLWSARSRIWEGLTSG